jgi:WD40 repeat protein
MTRLWLFAMALLFSAVLLGCGGEGKSGATLAVYPEGQPENTGPSGQEGQVGQSSQSGQGGGNNQQSAAAAATTAGPLDFARPIHLVGHKSSAIVGLAYSPDGNRLASASNAGEVMLWDLAKRSRRVLAAGGSGGERSLASTGRHIAFSPDGKMLFFGTVSAVTQWDVDSGNSVHTFSHTKVEGYTDGIVTSPDRKTVITYGGDGEGGESWKVWDVATKQEIFTVPFPSNARWAFSPDSKTLVSPRDKIHVYDLAKGKELLPIAERAEDLFFVDNNSLAVWGFAAGAPKYSIWDLGDRTGLATPKTREDRQGDLDRASTSWAGGRFLSPDRKTLVGFVDGVYHVGDFATRKSRGVLKCTAPLVFTPDNRTIVGTMHNASGPPNVFLAEIDAQTGKTRETLEIAYDGAKYDISTNLVLAISPTRPGTVTIGLANGLIVIHPLVGKSPGLKELASLPLTPAHTGGQREPADLLRKFKHGIPYALDFSHDGRYVALLGPQNLLWDVKSKKLLLSAIFSAGTKRSPQPDFALAPYPTLMVVPDEDLVLSAHLEESLCRYSLSTGQLKSQQDHKDTTLYASFRMAPDGKTAAALVAEPKTGGTQDDRTYKLALVDPATLAIKTELTTFDELRVSTGDVAFSANGQWLALSPRRTGKEIRIWNLASRQEKLMTASGAGFGAHGRRPGFIGDATLVTYNMSEQGPSLDFYDIASGQKTYDLNPSLRHATRIRNLAVSPGSPVFAAVNEEGELVLQDLKTGGVRMRQPAHDDAAYAVAMSPDGKLVATAGADLKLKLWEVGNIPPERDFGPKQVIQDIQGEGDRGRFEITEIAAFDAKIGDDYARIALTPDGKLLAALSHEESGSIVRFWEPASRKQAAVWQDEGDVGYVGGPFRFTADGRWLVNDAATAFDVTGRRVRPAELIFSCMSLAPSSKTIVIGLEGPNDVKEKRLRFLDLPTLKERGAALDTFGSVRAVRHSPDGKLLVVLLHEGDEHRLLLLDPESGAVRATIAKWDSGNSPADHLAFSADSRMLAAEHSRYITAPGKLTWWDLSTATPKEVRTVSLSTGADELTFIADGRMLAVRLDDHEAVVYDVATGTPRSKSAFGLESDTQAEYAVICPRRGIFFSGRTNGELLIWDLVNARPLAKKEAHRATFLGVAISADERFLATAGKDNKVKVWALGN